MLEPYSNEKDFISINLLQQKREELIERFRSGIVKSEKITIYAEDYDFLKTILRICMIEGLRNSKLGWFDPISIEKIPILCVGIHAKKLIEIFNIEPICFGFDFNARNRIHFYLTIQMPSDFFKCMKYTTDLFWVEFIKLFSTGQCSFNENSPLKIKYLKRHSSGMYGFLKFVEYLVGTEIQNIDGQSPNDDQSGCFEIVWSAYENWKDLIEKIEKALDIANFIYRFLLRILYLKNYKKPNKTRETR